MSKPRKPQVPIVVEVEKDDNLAVKVAEGTAKALVGGSAVAGALALAKLANHGIEIPAPATALLSALGLSFAEAVVEKAKTYLVDKLTHEEPHKLTLVGSQKITISAEPSKKLEIKGVDQKMLADGTTNVPEGTKAMKAAANQPPKVNHAAHAKPKATHHAPRNRH